MAENITAQFWYDGQKEALTSKLNKHKFIWVKTNINDGALNPIMLTFKLPKTGKPFPNALSLVINPCDRAKNLLKLVYNKPNGTKSDFGVCTKGIAYSDDISVQLIEWIEMLAILGVDKTYLYTYSTHPNVTKTFNYYQQSGKAEVTKLTVPDGLPNQFGLQKTHYIDIGKINGAMRKSL